VSNPGISSGPSVTFTGGPLCFPLVFTPAVIENYFMRIRSLAVEAILVQVLFNHHEFVTIR
jgi:hypothetical protein